MICNWVDIFKILGILKISVLYTYCATTSYKYKTKKHFLLNHTYGVVWFVVLPFRRGGGQDVFDILFYWIYNWR